MGTPVEDALARVLKGGGSAHQWTGAGWLVAPDRLVTCAHVVNYALGRDWDHEAPPGDDAVIRIDLPNREAVGPGAPPPRAARVLDWFPPKSSAPPATPADIALLAPADADPVPLPQPPCTLPADAIDTATSGKAYGYPDGDGIGIIRDGEIRGSTGGLLQVTPQAGQTIGAGFSGGPFTDAAGRILGMTALHNPGHGIAGLIPVDTLELACPALRALRWGGTAAVTLHLRSEGEDLLVRAPAAGSAVERRSSLASLRSRVEDGDLFALHAALFADADSRDALLFPPRPTTPATGAPCASSAPTRPWPPCPGAASNRIPAAPWPARVGPTSACGTQRPCPIADRMEPSLGIGRVPGIAEGDRVVPADVGRGQLVVAVLPCRRDRATPGLRRVAHHPPPQAAGHRRARNEDRLSDTG
jgi:hypothetical protein